MNTQEILNAASVEAYLMGNARVAEAFDLPQGADLQVSFVARGEYNANYAFVHPVTGERLLFRINLGSQMHLDRQIAYEAHALDLLASSGRVPEVRFVDATGAYGGCGVLVETWLPGEPLDYAHDMEEAARILADVHAVDVPPTCELVRPRDPLQALLDECDAMLGVYRSWTGAHAETLARIDRLRAHAVKSHERAASAAVPVRAHVVNTELNSRNFLINKGGTGYLVDWEKPVIGEAEQDLAHFLAPITTFWKTDTLLTRGEMDGFLERYCATAGNRFDTSNVRTRVEDYMAATCLRGLTWCAMAYAQHESGVRRVADEYTYAKVQAYLTQDFFDAVWDVCAAK